MLLSNRVCEPFSIPDTTIFVSLAGSRLYGTSKHDSDYDYRGVFTQTRSQFLGFDKTNDTYELSKPDVSLFKLRKFFDLALNNNPNVMDILFSPTWAWIFATDTWRQIYDIRHAFLSRKAIDTFGGYAVSQFKKLKLKYDIKDAKHTLRLSMKVVDIARFGDYTPELESGELSVIRYLDYKEPQDSIIYIEDAFQRNLNAAVTMRSNLPETPNYDTVERLLVKLNTECVMREE